LPVKGKKVFKVLTGIVLNKIVYKTELD